MRLRFWRRGRHRGGKDMLGIQRARAAREESERKLDEVQRDIIQPLMRLRAQNNVSELVTDLLRRDRIKRLGEGNGPNAARS